MSFENVQSRYKICLLNVPFDDTYNNVIYFKNESERINYFKKVYNIVFNDYPLVNFNFGDGLNCECVVNNVAYTNSSSLNSIVSYNYCIVMEFQTLKDDSTGSTTYNPLYYFYFVKECKYLTGKQVQLKLKLDVFTTYMPSQYVNYMPICNIKRACLNRFSKNLDDETYRFNLTYDNSFFHIKEDLKYNKRMINYLPQKVFVNDSQEQLVREWFRKAIKYWVVIFLDPNYTSDSLKITTVNLPTGQYKTILFPVMNDDYQWQAMNNESSQGLLLAGSTIINGQAYNLNDILDLDTKLRAYIIDIRISKIPFDNLIIFKSTKIDYTIYTYQYFDEEISQLRMRLLDWTSDVDTVKIYGLGYFQKGGCFYLENTNIGYDKKVVISGQETYKYEICDVTDQLGKIGKVDFELVDKEDIKKFSNNIKYNPKMYSNTILDVILKYGNNNFTYELSSLGNTKLEVNYFESLGPSIVRSYIYITPQGLYNENTTKDFLGIVSSDNYSLTYYNEQLANYIANNKNAWLQTTAKIVTGTASSLVKSSIAGGESGGVAGALGGFGIGIVKSAFNVANSALQYNLNIDNLKSAPASIANIQGDVNLLLSIADLGIGIEIWEALPVDVDAFNDYCLRYGYKVNEMLYLVDYINIRKYWNYVQADIETMPQGIYKMNYKIENEIKNAFSNGIRFWNVIDVNTEITFNYNFQNYEKYLDDES